MARQPRQNQSPAFRAKVAVAAIKGENTLVEQEQDFDVHPNQIKQWRARQGGSVAERQKMIDRTAQQSVSRPVVALWISRGNVHDRPRPVPSGGLKLMHRIDQLHMELTFAADGCCKGLRVQAGFRVGLLNVSTLTKRMGIEALYRKPNTSKPASGHKIYPYLQRKLPVSITARRMISQLV